MNFYKHHLGDYAAATSHLSWDEDCAYRRLIDQYYKREAPIPADVKEACRLARATTPSHRRAVESVLREFFVLQDDGWHQKRCDGELVEAEGQGGERSAKAENERERQRRHRAERKRLFEQLRELDIVPAWDTKTEALRAMLPQPHVTLSECDESQHVTPDVTPVTRPVTCTATAIHKPLATSHKPEEDKDKARAPDFARAGEACKAMRQAGMASVNPSDPRLLALLGAGATVPEFGHAAAEAVPQGKGFGWVLGAVEGRRRDASKVVNLPAQQRDQKPWDGAR